ncbi:hypothetical protein BDN72DRAFT_965404 [Pluteus cervinus]|uniref:Uncharacterized protein n=1 Tax=Pluteus cervinus TaxID=181527 RepID=A0ACD3A6W6_9AGAR|nr:hypothetical protein BDN72DRAFT_965404 [Pluteus cervinus]
MEYLPPAKSRGLSPQRPYSNHSELTGYDVESVGSIPTLQSPSPPRPLRPQPRFGSPPSTGSSHVPSSSRSTSASSSDGTGSSSSQEEGSQTFKSIIFNVIVTIFCLGVPYFFLKSSQYQFGSEGRSRYVAPLFLLAAGTNVMSAVMLGASFMCLYLPELGRAAQIANIVTMVSSALSMSSTIFALLEYQAEVKRRTRNLHVGFELRMKHSIIFSLPLVFLEYSIIAFVTTLALHLGKGI